jgi:hypothetical protein
MPYCPACRGRIRGERERVGARCPHCRLPLYERPELFKPRPAGDDHCSAHPQNAALGTCQRCGSFQCDVCRTRWRNRTFCVACVNRLLEANQDRPEEVRAHTLQAVLALVLGIASWVALAVFIVLAIAALSEGGQPALILLAVLALLASPIPALIGLGLGTAALRSRGSHMILATIGLVLSGLNLGALIGLFTFQFWQN